MDIKHHIYAVKNLDTAGNPTDDYPFTDEFIGHMLYVARATLLENKLSKYHPISQANYQTLKMELTDGGPTGCSDLNCLRVTKDVVPTIIRSRRGDSIRITDLDGNEIIRTSLLRYKAGHGTSLTAKAVKWYFINGKIIIINNVLLDHILVHALFEESPSTCDSTDHDCVKNFPIDADLVDPLYKITLDYLAKSQKNGEDTTNDASSKRYN